MSAYQYQALNAKGKLINGIIDADSERQARHQLRQQHLTPTEIRLFTPKNFNFSHQTLSTPHQALLTRQLATLLSAGLPLDEALSGVIEQTEKPRVQRILTGVRHKILEGYALAQALNEYPKAFPELYRATVRAGEHTGRLDLVLNKLADYTEHQQTMRSKIQQALIYPSLMIIISFAIVSFLLAFVVPKIIDVFSSSGQTLPYMTHLLITLSTFLQIYGWISVLIMIGLLSAFKYCLKYEPVKQRWHKFLLKLPMVAYFIRTTNIARYIHTFGILFAAGLNILETMRVAASVLHSRPMQQAFNHAALQVKEGSSIHGALKATRFIPPMAMHLISSGEKSGYLAEMMAKAALYMDMEIKRLIETALTLLEPLIILLMGAVVLFIVLATLLPIFSMEQLVT
ncbi:MAG: type II secretion system protein GspF [Legionellaceae bacterium]|nr:type II secretion system protein GspF [Legionellaceae bacterium]HAF87608.1 type II secretion system protein GspF [Legionellales bacterium]|tara:strand:- start:1081 stop:2280 length:1200 start_codon:yes stop_codon:yes gene_type:complete